MKHNIESIANEAPARQELVQFLASFGDENRGQVFWRNRLAFWWDENPFGAPDLPKGWVLRCDGAIVGFLGLIPFEYTCRGQVHRAFAATTWRVAKEHRNASLPMFMKWHQLGSQFILLDTTPNAEVSKILDRFGYRLQNTVSKYFFPLRGAGRGVKDLAQSGLNLLNRLFLSRRPLKIVALKDAFHINQGYAAPDRLEKRISREYLTWYCNSPDVRKEFIGCVDRDGALSAYLTLQPEKYGEQDVLSVIDYFSARSDKDELAALIRHVSVHPESLSLRGNFSFLLVNVLGEVVFVRKPPGVIYRESDAKHYYSLPGQLAGLKKRCVLAEGDYGC